MGQNSYMCSPDPCVRPIEPADVAAVVRLVHELAQYERAARECALTEAQLEVALFTARPALFGHVATIGGQVVGCALWFLNFSTWRGTHGIYLEDLYVQPAHRGKGWGKRCCGNWPGNASSAGTSGSNGPSLIGTSPPSISMVLWARRRKTNGPSSALPTNSCHHWRRADAWSQALARLAPTVTGVDVAPL